MRYPDISIYNILLCDFSTAGLTWSFVTVASSEHVMRGLAYFRIPSPELVDIRHPQHDDIIECLVPIQYKCLVSTIS